MALVQIRYHQVVNPGQHVFQTFVEFSLEPFVQAQILSFANKEQLVLLDYVEY